jgi:hypothetical protein
VAQKIVHSEYLSDEVENELEDVDDADLINHMQMRVNLDIPVETEESAVGEPPAKPAVGSADSSELPADAQPPAQATAKLPSAAMVDVAKPQANPFTGNQIVLGAALGAALVIIGALLALGLRAFLTRPKNISEDELRSAGKAWMLDWALGYEPDDEQEEDLKEELKIAPRKKMPPMATASDSGDTDEEEPEAESDSGELLEDAVFVAQQVEIANGQVEVANEANDAGYGFDRHTSLADQIRCDLR